LLGHVKSCKMNGVEISHSSAKLYHRIIIKDVDGYVSLSSGSPQWHSYPLREPH